MKRRMLLVYLTLVVTMGLAGIAYASWTSNLDVEVTVETGAFQIIWTDVSLDRSDEPQYQGSYVAVPELRLSPDGSVIAYRVTNAFPGWTSTIQARVANTGTIPAIIDKVALAVDEGIEVTGIRGIQGLKLGAGEVSDLLTFKVSALDTVEQRATYRFTVTLIGTQWNLARDPGPGSLTP